MNTHADAWMNADAVAMIKKLRRKKKEKTMPIFTITVELTGHTEIEVEAETVEEAVLQMPRIEIADSIIEIADSIEEIKAVSATDEKGDEVWFY